MLITLKTESIAMIPPKVPARYLLALIMSGVLCWVVAGKVPAAELSRVATPNCQCQSCDCSGRTGKDNFFLKGMRFFIGHFQGLLPSKSVCDETSCDDACDAMMIEELIELQDAGDFDQSSSASDNSTNELRQIKVDSLSGSTDIQPINVRQTLPDAGEPSDRPSEDLPRGRLRLPTPRIPDPVPVEQSKTNLIPTPIRNAQSISSSD